jgi:hypothetical protein
MTDSIKQMIKIGKYPSYIKYNCIGCYWIGTLSTARNSFARKQVFQANPKIRCLVLDNLKKKKI